MPELAVKQERRVSLAELYPLLTEILEHGGTFSLTVTGMSMYPFLVGGRDKVTLAPVDRELKKNDLPLYRRADGSFVLHRIVKCEQDGTYTCCGDHQWTPETGLRREQMVALATAFVRKGRCATERNVLYRAYRTVWTWLLRWRPWIFSMDTRLRRCISRRSRKSAEEARCRK